VAKGEYVGNLVASSLDGSVLDFAADILREHSLGLLDFPKVRVVAGVTLNTNPPALLRHSEHEGPSFLGVEVDVSQNEQALVRT